MIHVDIEVEQFYSTTSEEEIEVNYSMSKKKTMQQGKMSPTGSQGDLHASSFNASGRKKKDHMKIFEKRMGEKLMWNKMLSGSKSSANKSGISRKKSVLVPNTLGPLNNSDSKSALKKTSTMTKSLKTNQVQP